MGPPGSGKGTQAKNLAQKLRAFYFGTGDLMREESKKNTEYGKIFQKIWDNGKGELVPDHIVAEFVADKFKHVDFGQGIIFDGFPRTIQQAQLLEKIFSDRREDYIVLDIEVADESIVERMTSRRVCTDCGQIYIEGDASQCAKCNGKLVRRQEDESEVVKKRLAIYKEQTRPLVQYYKSKNKLFVVDGEPSIEIVEKEIALLINF